MRNIRAAGAGAALVADTRQWEWQNAGACRDEGPDLFFASDGERQPERDAREAAAKKICASCPIQYTCREHALDKREQAGVWGGLSEDELAAERRRRIRRASEAARAKAPKPKPKKPPKPEPVRVDGTGVQRRLRALATLGHGPTMIANRMTHGSKSLLGDLRDRLPRPVLPELAQELAALYPVLLDQPAGPLGAQVVAKAQRQMWLGPEFWEGVNIDDPNATPREVPAEETRAGKAAIEQARKMLAEVGVAAEIVTHDTAA